MRRTLTAAITVITLCAALAIPGRLAAQQQEHKDKLPRYRVIDLGTLGGTVSGALAINSKGWVTGFSFLPGDANLHALLWRRGVKTDLGTLGGPNSTPNGFMDSASVNQRGEIAGAAESSASDPLGENFFLCNFPDGLGLGLLCLPFLWENGAMMPLPTLGGNNGAAFQINNRGQAVGAAENTTHDPTCVAPQILQFRPVLWEKGEIRELPTVAGDPDGVAFAINDRGQAVGVSTDCTLTPGHALLWHDGNVTDMGTLGGLALAPNDINNHGQVVGNAFHNNTNRAFLWQNGVAIDLGTLPGDVIGHANAINDKGQVIGQSADANNNNGRGFIWQKGVMTDLNTLIPADASLYLVDPQDINARGEIVGGATEKSTGAFHAFLAIPCDEETDTDACEDQAKRSIAAGDGIGDRPQAALPENVQKVLQQRLGWQDHFAGHGIPRN